MAKIVTAMDYWINGLQLSFVMAEAQSVIAMRAMGAVGLWVRANDNTASMEMVVAGLIAGGPKGGQKNL